MTSGFNQQQYQTYTQYPQQVYYPAAQTAGAVPGASAVNIQIFNPTANAAPQTQHVMPLYQNASIYGTQGQAPVMQYPINYNAPINQTSSYNNVSNEGDTIKPVSTNVEAVKEDSKKTEEKKKKEKVILTDDYIKSLENYLNNQDPKIRLTAAKELLERFKEDDTRKNDPALCALLNKVIQDPKASVRYIGLTTLDVGYAGGNNETVDILKQLQSRTDLEYGEDSILASQILLKMSGQKVQVPDTTAEVK